LVASRQSIGGISTRVRAAIEGAPVYGAQARISPSLQRLRDEARVPRIYATAAWPAAWCGSTPAGVAAIGGLELLAKADADALA